jgi:hypothetical protein
MNNKMEHKVKNCHWQVLSLTDTQKADTTQNNILNMLNVRAA